MNTITRAHQIGWGEAYRHLRATCLSFGLPSDSNFDQPREEREASAAFSIVIPIQDGAPLERCLRSVERYSSEAQVILVDDGSTQPEIAFVLQQFLDRKEWEYVRSGRAQGHSRATESGTRLAIRPHLCLLNADTVVTPWSWHAALEAFENDPRIAVTGPSTSHASTRQMIRKAELCRHFWNDSQVFGFAQKYVKAQPPRSWVELPDVGGFAFFIRREVWEKCGGFDPLLPDYGNEVELCRRISNLGLRIIWTRNSYIHHLGHQSYSRVIGDKKAIENRSSKAQGYIDLKHA